jgi:hypothetical protein
VMRERSDFTIGQQICLSAPKTSLHLFDAESAKRLDYQA